MRHGSPVDRFLADRPTHFIVQVGVHRFTCAGTDAIYATYVNQRENTARRSLFTDVRNRVIYTLVRRFL